MAGFQQLKVTREVDFTGAVQIGILGGIMGKGRVFFVDGTSGSDSYGVQSQNPNYPMETITGALDLCTSAVGDAIVVMANSPSSPPANETFPIAMDVQGVLLTGLYSRGLLSDSGIGADEVDTACIEIGAHYVAIENMYLGIKTGSTTADVITFNGTNSYFGGVLRNCQIESQYAARYGIYMAYDQPYYLVEDCKFGRSDLANFSSNCIYIGNGTGVVIRRNLFTGSTGACVSLGGSCGNVFVVDNHFQLASDLSGGAVTCAAGSSNNFIDGNTAGFGDTSMAQNPFLDSSTAGYNDWGLNYNQEAATLPA